VGGRIGSSAPFWWARISLGAAEIGHIHPGGILEFPFPRSIRDALLAEGLASEHHWVPNLGWTTFRTRTEENFRHTLWLLRLCYLRYALKSASNPRNLLEQENEKLHLNPRFPSLLEPFVPKPATRISTKPVSA
jgi:hypothetical protein